MKIPSRKLTALVMAGILTVVVFFHIAVILGIVPGSIVWGSRISSPGQLYTFEAVSLTINITVILLTLASGRFLGERWFLAGRIAMWVVFALFALNTVGNLFSNSSLEQAIFTPLTILVSLMALRLAWKD